MKKQRLCGILFLSDQTQTADTGKERTDTAQNAAMRGRFLRVTLSGTPANQPPALAELEITGTLNAE
jgi:hypothetical protein